MPGYHVDFNHDPKRQAENSLIDVEVSHHYNRIEEHRSEQFTSDLFEEEKKIENEINIFHDSSAVMKRQKRLSETTSQKPIRVKKIHTDKLISSQSQASKISNEEYKRGFRDKVAYVAKIIAGVIGFIIIAAYFYFRFKVFWAELKVGFAAALAGNVLVLALYIILIAALLYLLYVGLTQMINWLLKG